MKHFYFSIVNKNQAVKELKCSRMLLFSNIFTIAFILWTSPFLKNKLSTFDSFIYNRIKMIISPQLTFYMRMISELCSVYTLTAILTIWGISSIRKKFDLIYIKMMPLNVL